MGYRIEIKIPDGFDPSSGQPLWVWKPMRPTGQPPYTWARLAEAERVRDSTYPPASGMTYDNVRIVEVPDAANIGKGV